MSMKHLTALKDTIEILDLFSITPLSLHYLPRLESLSSSISKIITIVSSEYAQNLPTEKRRAKVVNI